MGHCFYLQSCDLHNGRGRKWDQVKEGRNIGQSLRTQRTTVSLCEQISERLRDQSIAVIAWFSLVDSPIALVPLASHRFPEHWEGSSIYSLFGWDQHGSGEVIHTPIWISGNPEWCMSSRIIPCAKEWVLSISLRIRGNSAVVPWLVTEDRVGRRMP